MTPIKHAECGGIAYYIRTDTIASGQMLRAAQIVFPNGGSPSPGDRVSCRSCGLPVGFPVEPAQTVRRQGYGTTR